MQRLCDNDEKGNYNSCVSIAIFGDISNLDPGVSSIAFYIMNTLEVMVLILLFLAVPIVLPVIWKSNTFHLNMMRFLIFLVAQSYIYLSSRAVLYVFQIGIVKIANETGNPRDYVLIGASLGRYYQLTSIIFVLAAIVIERCCATVYMAEYEKQKKSHISLLLIIAVIALSALESASITFSVNQKINHFLLAMMTTIGVCCSIICVWIYLYNERRLKRLKNASDKYTLSLKFQLIENIRAFRFMRTAALLGIPSILIVVSPFAVGIAYLPILNMRVVCGQTFEMLFAMFYTGAIVGLPLMTPSWLHGVTKRSRVLKYFIRESPSKVGQLKGKNESDTYFDDLHSVWNTRLEAKMNPKSRK